jgi:hypothetical protein
VSLIKKIRLAEQKASNNALWDRKLVFVHVPKNYGTTTADFLFRLVDSENGHELNRPAHTTTHMTAPQITSLPKYANHNTFCFTRNPYSRFVSVVKWRTPKDALLDWPPASPTQSRLPIGIDDFHTSTCKALQYIIERKVQEPTDYEFEIDSKKLDRMFLPQTTWHNNTTFLYQCEDYYNELWRFMQEHNIARTKKVSLVVQHEGDFLDANGKPDPANMTHRNQSEKTIDKTSYKEIFYDILKRDPGLHRGFIDYYGADFSLFDYEPEVLS